jgi:Amt family ammonium transporter
VGIFSTNPEHSFVTQLIGVGAYAIFTAACAAILFGAIKATMGLRVSEEEELEGLDLGEHGMHAYEIVPSSGPFDDAHLRGSSSTAVASTQLATESS